MVIPHEVWKHQLEGVKVKLPLSVSLSSCEHEQNLHHLQVRPPELEVGVVMVSHAFIHHVLKVFGCKERNQTIRVPF